MFKQLRRWWLRPLQKMTYSKMFWEGAGVGLLLALLYLAFIPVGLVVHGMWDDPSFDMLSSLPQMLFLYLTFGGAIFGTGAALVGGITAVLLLALFRTIQGRIHRQAAYWVGGMVGVLICHLIDHLIYLPFLLGSYTEENFAFSAFFVALPFLIYTTVCCLAAARIHRNLERITANAARP